MQTGLKSIIEYILRVCIFLLLNRQFAFQLPLILSVNLSKCFEKYYTNAEDWLSIVVIVFIIYMYIVAKWSGVFKKLNNLHFLKAFLIIFLLNLILNFSYMFSVQFNPFKVSFHRIDEFWYFYPFLFVCYRILNFLGKKYPNFFGRIGYYCSVEFYRDVFRKYIKRMQNKRN